MSNPEQPATTPKKSRGPSKIVILIVAVICTAAGASVPWVVSARAAKSEGHDAPAAAGASHKDGAHKTDAVPFGEVIVNLQEERMTRYIRVKIVLEVDAEAEKVFSEHLAKAKPGLKSWLIGYLSGKTLKDVGGSIGVKRLQREILEHFEEVLYPEGNGPLRQVLFEEYAVQ